mgnify:CR=1 FL=1
MDILRTSGLFIPNDYKFIDNIKTDLTRMVNEWGNTVQHLKLYKEFTDGILIPRYYPLTDCNIIDKTCKGKIINIKSNIVLNSERQEKVIERFKSERNGIIQLEPGTGKTVLMIHLISNYYKTKSLIVTHKDKLLEQWESEFFTWTDIDKKRIGRLFTNNFENILTNCDIILSTPHIFFLNENNPDFLEALGKSEIGTLVIDECHVGIGPEQFSKVSLLVNAYRTFGLSATPYRNDGLNDILHYHLGDVVYIGPPKENELLKPKIYTIKFSFGVVKRNAYFFFDNKFHLGRYYAQLHKSQTYLDTVSKYIIEAYNNNRNILVLGKNVLPLFKLAETCGLPPKDVGLFTPSIDNKKYKKLVNKLTDTTDLDEAFNCKRVVFSTYAACRDGNNRKDLDTLIMACPTSNPTQAIGRILRNMENKKTPIVVAFVDTDGPRVPEKDPNTGKIKYVSYFEHISKFDSEMQQNK